MSDFVLVHGAWHGGWCWDAVAERLRAQGHACVAPTLRGLAHRRGALTPELDADDHVDDVASLVEALDLRQIVLVLHSYAGLLGPALQARLGPRIVHRCFIEAVIPTPGQCMLDLVAPAAAQRFERAVHEHGDGQHPEHDGLDQRNHHHDGQCNEQQELVNEIHGAAAVKAIVRSPQFRMVRGRDAELPFVIVNETVRAVAYDQAVLWDARTERVVALSGAARRTAALACAAVRLP